MIYIDNEYCRTISQLRSYFTKGLVVGSNAYDDLLDYGRHGDLSSWLREIGEPSIAESIDGIDSGMPDSEYMSKLGFVITGDVIPVPPKPSFGECFQIEGVNSKITETDATFTLTLRVLLSVNESYIIKAVSGWGTQGKEINPSTYAEGSMLQLPFSFRKRPGKILDEISLYADEDKLSIFALSIKMIRVEDCILTMVHIPGTGDLPGFYVSETPITIQQYKALYPKGVPVAQGVDWLDYYEKFGTREYEEFTIAAALTVKIVLDFVNKIRQPITFCLPTREQWLHMTENYYERVKWCIDSKFLGIEYKAIAWEMMQDSSYDIYCLLGVAYENGKRVIKGNNFRKGQERDNIAFRLVCSESEINTYYNNSNYENR